MIHFDDKMKTIERLFLWSFKIFPMLVKHNNFGIRDPPIKMRMLFAYSLELKTP